MCVCVCVWWFCVWGKPSEDGISSMGVTFLARAAGTAAGYARVNAHRCLPGTLNHTQHWQLYYESTLTAFISLLQTEFKTHWFFFSCFFFLLSCSPPSPSLSPTSGLHLCEASLFLPTHLIYSSPGLKHPMYPPKIHWASIMARHTLPWENSAY